MKRSGWWMPAILATLMFAVALPNTSVAQQKKLVLWTHWDQNPEFNKWYEAKGKEFAQKSGYEVEAERMLGVRTFAAEPDLAEHLGLRTREQLLGWISAAGLQVLGRIDTRPLARGLPCCRLQRNPIRTGALPLSCPIQPAAPPTFRRACWRTSWARSSASR